MCGSFHYYIAPRSIRDTCLLDKELKRSLTSDRCQLYLPMFIARLNSHVRATLESRATQPVQVGDFYVNISRAGGDRAAYVMPAVPAY